MTALTERTRLVLVAGCLALAAARAPRLVRDFADARRGPWDCAARSPERDASRLRSAPTPRQDLLAGGVRAEKRTP